MGVCVGRDRCSVQRDAWGAGRALALGACQEPGCSSRQGMGVDWGWGAGLLQCCWAVACS